MNARAQFQQLLRFAPPGGPAAVSIDGPASSVSYAELEERVEGAMAELVQAGVGPGKAVALRLPPSHSYLFALLGTWRLGATAVLIDFRTKDVEFERCLSLAPADFAVDAGQPRGAFAVREHLPLSVRAVGAESAGRLADYALVQFTSGSTGQPKAIGRTPASLCEEARRIDGIPNFVTAGEGVLVLNSLMHSFGLLAGVLTSLRRGARVVLPRSPLPGDLASALERRVSIVLGVPFHFELLANLPQPVLLPELRLALSGGERLPRTTGEAFARRFGVPVGQAYGMTETGLLTCEPTPPPGSVGKLLPGVEGKVMDGELWIALPTSPYLPGSDPRSFEAGWLRTFDLVELEPDSQHLQVHGRADSLVISGGLKIDLTEIEESLREMPGVRESVVLKADVIEAFVAADDGVAGDTILNWLRQRLSDYKLPKRVHVRRVLPRTATGKTVREREALLAALQHPNPCGPERLSQGGT